MVRGPTFSSYETDVLFDNIKKNRLLWDPNDPGFKNIIVRKKVWNKCAAIVGRSVDDCKGVWHGQLRLSRSLSKKLQFTQEANYYRSTSSTPASSSSAAPTSSSLAQANDELTLFFGSLEKNAKKMPPMFQIKAKMALSTAMIAIEKEWLQELDQKPQSKNE